MYGGNPTTVNNKPVKFETLVATRNVEEVEIIGQIKKTIACTMYLSY
jgi:hypothetical protein